MDGGILLPIRGLCLHHCTDRSVTRGGRAGTKSDLFVSQEEEETFCLFTDPIILVIPFADPVNV